MPQHSSIPNQFENRIPISKNFNEQFKNRSFAETSQRDNFGGSADFKAKPRPRLNLEFNEWPKQFDFEVKLPIVPHHLREGRNKKYSLSVYLPFSRKEHQKKPQKYPFNSSPQGFFNGRPKESLGVCENMLVHSQIISLPNQDNQKGEFELSKKQSSRSDKSRVVTSRFTPVESSKRLRFACDSGQPSISQPLKAEGTKLQILQVDTSTDPSLSIRHEFSPYSKFQNIYLSFQAASFKKQKEVLIIEGSRPIGWNFSSIKKAKRLEKEDFEVGKKMGKGQFGEVELVRHRATGWICGMKTMKKAQLKEENYINQIARELSIQFYLSHRNITPLYGYFEDEEHIYLLVEFCPDGSLVSLLRKNRRLEELETSAIIRQILEGIDYIHKEKIIHRDIKPENILLSNGVAKITDFGWAVYRGMGMRKTASGSPLYYSPEIVLGNEYDEKIDIWDIGMMAYECLIGKVPFRVYTEMDLKRIVSDEISFPDYVDVTDQAKDFILGALQKDPSDRSTVKQMLRHPFITTHSEPKLPKNIMQEIYDSIG